MLYTHKGNVLECATSNFFIFRKDCLVTPKENVLKGTTRNFVVNLAKNKFPVEERKISLKEALSAEEAFITATIKNIMPVAKIDSQKINTGRVGPKTKYLMEVFKRYTQNY